ncbi:MAG: SDR family NAD(P)-dependent oxidoreductase [Silicimonas sp.]|nr:SDR family NAD(P)-dependent oxidoreductase [Silicimonas sp.]
MRNALLIGASGGIGAAIGTELESRSFRVTGLSRSSDGLDVTDETSVERLLGCLDNTFDLIFVATGALTPTGAPPEKAIRDVSEAALVAQFKVNAIGPMLVLKHALHLLPKDRRSVFAAMSARVGSIGDNKLGGWHGYRASKAALNQLIHGASIELKRTHKQAIAVCLHPGTVATRFTEKYAARHKTTEPDVAASQLIDVFEGLEVGQTGRFYDFAGLEIPW